jgi:hypothetical protein
MKQPSKLTKEEARTALNEILRRYRIDDPVERHAPGSPFTAFATNLPVTTEAYW